MVYVSLYRKYRPQTFEDVVGQEHVTTTLKNAIQQGRVASGYLFCGTRGTAKTTCARILAKALNCIGPDGANTAPTPEPCGECEPCKRIAASSFVDVLEMDAASHGKVDDVRDLVASIKFPPMEGRYKVYIIDEAHQLSRDAMDAFLKTLEEPPDRVVFILATTEKEKLPITIASRCQVFEFKRGSIAQIAKRLSEVLKSEKVQADPAAITLVARAAEGSYRDSLSLLEQVLAYKREKITASDVSAVLGTVDEDMLSRVVGLVAASDAAGAFALADEVLASGKEVRQFLKSLSARFRDLLYLAVGAPPIAGGEALGEERLLQSQAGQFSPPALLHALEILTEAERETRTNNQHRLLLEMALLRLMHLPHSSQAAVLPTAAPVAVPAPPVHPPQVTSDIPPSEPLVPESLTSENIIENIIDTDSDDSDIEDEEELDVPLPGDADLDELPDELPEAAQSEEMQSFVVTTDEQHDQADDLLQVQQVSAQLSQTYEPKTQNGNMSPDSPPELIQLQKSWQEVINRMESRSAGGARVLRECKPAALNDRTFVLEFTNPLYVELLERDEKRRKAIEDVIDKTLNDERTYKIKCALQGKAVPAKVAIGTAPRVRETSPIPKEERQHSALMDEVIAVFGGRILDDHEGKG